MGTLGARDGRCALAGTKLTCALGTIVKNGGFTDVFFDLANLSVNSELNDEADERLVRSYFGSVTASRWARLQLMKMMSEFREGMWAVVQQAISTLDTDFVGYAEDRLRNCERIASRPDFERWLDDARSPVL